MSAVKVFQTITSVSIGNNKTMPCAHICFQKNSAPALPWCVYYLDELNGFCADSTMYARHNSWIVEHYYKTYSASIESNLETALINSFGTFRKDETWVEDEGCYLNTYYFDEID